MGQVFRAGDRVYWEDPDNGICSGRYTVIGVSGEVISLRRGKHYAEAPANELSKLKSLNPERGMP